MNIRLAIENFIHRFEGCIDKSPFATTEPVAENQLGGAVRDLTSDAIFSSDFPDILFLLVSCISVVWLGVPGR